MKSKRSPLRTPASASNAIQEPAATNTRRWNPRAAQPAASPTIPPGPNANAKQPVRVEDLPPQVRLGVRAELLRRQLSVIPTVVIVRDERSYVVAISEWSPEKGRFPVLIDDGTPQARLQIARFVRAFEPTKVVRWSAPEENTWPAEKGIRKMLVEAALSSSWGAEGPGRALERYKQLGHNPPGVVAASMDDPAWTAVRMAGPSRAPTRGCRTAETTSAQLPLRTPPRHRS